MEPPGLYVELWQRQDLQGADVMTEPRRGGGRREDGVKFVIISAEDLGYGDGINRAVAVLHDLGRVTSASLTVNTTGTAQAVAIAAARPRLSLGLHVNFTNEDDRLVEFDDPAVCRRELRRQFDHFVTLTGRRPTHLNSHHHVHRRPACRPSFQELADEHNLPLRDRPPVVFKGGFYGQWEHGVSQKKHVSFEALRSILCNGIGRGIYEVVVHPGYLDARANDLYYLDRQWEAETLADPRLLGLLREERISLISYHELSEAIAQLERDRGWIGAPTASRTG